MVLEWLQHVDRQIVEWVADHRIGLLTEFFLDITALGSATVVLLVILGLWMVGDRVHAIMLATGGLMVAAVVKGLKWGVARERPDVVADALVYSSEYAFPSGHTAAAVVLAVILADWFPRARGYFYGVAILVAVSRVYLGVHYVTDVAAGAVVGGLVGLLVIRYQAQIVGQVQKLSKR